VIATGFDTGRGVTRPQRRSRPGPPDRNPTIDDRQRSSLEIRDDEIDIPAFLRDR